MDNRWEFYSGIRPVTLLQVPVLWQG